MISAVEELLEQAHRVIVWQLEPLAVVRVVVEVPVARPEVTTISSDREADEPPTTICNRPGRHHGLDPALELFAFTRAGVVKVERYWPHLGPVLDRALHVISRRAVGDFNFVMIRHPSHLLALIPVRGPPAHPCRNSSNNNTNNKNSQYLALYKYASNAIISLICSA